MSAGRRRQGRQRNPEDTSAATTGGEQAAQFAARAERRPGASQGAAGSTRSHAIWSVAWEARSGRWPGRHALSKTEHVWTGHTRSEREN